MARIKLVESDLNVKDYNIDIKSERRIKCQRHREFQTLTDATRKPNKINRQPNIKTGSKLQPSPISKTAKTSSGVVNNGSAAPDRRPSTTQLDPAFQLLESRTALRPLQSVRQNSAIDRSARSQVLAGNRTCRRRKTR